MRYKSLIAAFIAALLLYVSVFAQPAITGTIIKNANLRAGPGTSYAMSGTIKAGQAVTIVGKNEAGDWYHLSNGTWIAAFLVKVVGTATPVVTQTGTTPKQTPRLTTKITSTSMPGITVTPTSKPTQIDILHDSVGQAYVLGLKDIYGAIAKNSSILEKRFSQASDNPSVIFTQAWRSDVVIGLSGYKITAMSIRGLVPPAYFVDMQSDLLKIADHLDKAVNLLSNGIDNVSGSQIVAGGKELQVINQLIKSAKAKADIIIGNMSLPATETSVATSASMASTPTPELAWYSGGTLHKATVGEWKIATERNKLATAADWAYVGFDNVHFSSPDEVKSYAQELLICVDTAIAGVSYDDNPVADIATLCVIYMKKQ